MLSSPLYQLLALLAVHWVADFVLQTHWQATNKSKDNEALSRHVLTYTIVLAFVVPFVFPLMSPKVATLAAVFVIFNGALHFATDWCTSRLSSRLYAKQDFHNFFVVIGLDQLIHQLTLAATTVLFFH